ncbi:MAG: NUDIX hydrolase [Planctomycetes bacterium]|nr:NUDIX hydrolase [Planctomycetota bacterium]
MPIPKQPRLTVDVIIELEGGVVLVERKFEPHGWAIPGGFVEWGETLETAAIREAKEETGLDVTLKRQFHAYSDPNRDPRGHTVCVVFEGTAQGTPVGGDDAKTARVFRLDELPQLAFDHAQILEDYRTRRY